MVATMDAAQRTRFADLFDSPSVARMLDLSWPDFEDFVQYVFECAGYHVKKVASYHFRHHVDLELRHQEDGDIVAHVEVRRYSTAHIIKGRVLQFLGSLVAKKVPQGYIITTSDFTQPAYKVAEESEGRVRLLNGDHFVRYIRYVGGSRLVGDDVQASGFQQPYITPDWLFTADAVRHAGRPAATVLAVVNAKGGVAKTTTAQNLALALAEKHDQRVLLMDMDGQASLTGLLPQPIPPQPRGKRSPKPPAWPPPADTAFLTDYFLGHHALQDLVRPTRFDRVWLVPADERLFLLDMNGGMGVDQLLAFVQDLRAPSFAAPDGSLFDWIILDTPPAQSFCTRAALAASDDVVLAACAETMAVRGANWALTTARTMRALMGDGVEVVGCLLTRWKKNAPADQALISLSDLLSLNQVRRFSKNIPVDPRIERGHMQTAWGKLKHLLRLPQGPASDAYVAFAGEVLTYAHRS